MTGLWFVNNVDECNDFRTVSAQFPTQSLKHFKYDTLASVMEFTEGFNSCEIFTLPKEHELLSALDSKK